MPRSEFDFGQTNDSQFISESEHAARIGSPHVEKVTYNATRDPLPTDDVSQGYAGGSAWINLLTNKFFKCTDATLNNAAWLNLGTLTEIDNLQIYYVGKHGLDTKDGRTINEAKLTFGNAVAAAVAQTPSSSNRFAIVCMDSGVYAESVDLGSYISIYAPNARIQGNFTVYDESAVTLGTLESTTGTGILKASGSGDVYVILRRYYSTNSRGVFNAGTGSLEIEVEYMKQTGGFAVGDTTNAQGIMHVDIQDLDMDGATAIGRGQAGNTTVRIGNLADWGGTTTAFALSLGNIWAFVNRISADTAYNISGGIFCLTTCEIVGTETQTGGSVYVNRANKEFSNAASEGESGTTATTKQDKLTHDVDVPAGTYRVDWYCEIANDSNNVYVAADVQLDGSELGQSEMRRVLYYHAFAGHKIVSLDGEHTLKIRYQTGSGGAAWIQHARITVERRG